VKNAASIFQKGKERGPNTSGTKKDGVMDIEKLFSSAHALVLQTPAYQGAPGFPEEVEKISPESVLIFWLGNTPFPSDHHGEAAAISELLVILTSFDLTSLPQMLVYLLQTSSNVIAPSRQSIRAVEEAVAQENSMQARELAGQTLAWEVKRWRPHLRAEMAGWIACQMSFPA
jgi:hypothetical protein